ncbi:MAG: carboxypeptidase-like regulatory domain-containing protein [Candidatus Aminicenantes bacterium]|nr:carboxypeptidase-like regulatory domain-containing protein [Candidatus Aminicenantes bacterium]
MSLMRIFLVPGLFVCLTAGVLLEAQIDTGTILGRVLLPDGSPAVNAQVSLRHQDTNQAVELLTSPAGYFRRDGLPVGQYELTVASAGFRTMVLRDLELLVGQSLRADFQLRRGDAAETSVQQAGPALLGAGRTDLGQVIDQEKLDSLPVNARDMGKLAGLAAGAAPSASPPRSRGGATSRSWG